MNGTAKYYYENATFFTFILYNRQGQIIVQTFDIMN